VRHLRRSLAQYRRLARRLAIDLCDRYCRAAWAARCRRAARRRKPRLPGRRVWPGVGR